MMRFGDYEVARDIKMRLGGRGRPNRALLHESGAERGAGRPEGGVGGTGGTGALPPQRKCRREGSPRVKFGRRGEKRSLWL